MSEQPVEERSLFHALLLGFGLSWLIAVLLLLATALIGAAIAYSWAAPRITTFTQAADISWREAAAIGLVGWQKSVQQTNGYQNILILGLDEVANRGDASILTDTIIIASLHLESGAVTTLSLPRDIWSELYQTKINSLYYYGQDRYPNQPERFTTEVLSELTEVPIHHTLVISLERLAELIDLVGGIDVTVATGFTDLLFPRSDVDIQTENDPAKLYQTVVFEAGPQRLSGARALEYIRSRKAEGKQGGDEARNDRQQQVIQSLFSRLSDSDNFRNPELLGRLFAYYQIAFSRFISIPEAIATTKAIYPVRSAISFKGNSLSIQANGKAGVLSHPPLTEYNGQWLYVITNLAEFRSEIKQKLYGTPSN